MANVTIEDAALKDPRYAVLGKLLGTSKFDARGRMVEVWSYCTESCAYAVRSEMLDALVEFDGFGPLMVSAGLAETLEDGSFRIAGARGRIEWLATLRKNAKKGGAANRANWQAKRIAEGEPVGIHSASQKGSQSQANTGALLLLSGSDSDTVDPDPRSSDPVSRKDSQEALDLALFLADAIRAHSPAAKLKPEGWAHDIDLAIRVDGRSPQELKRAVDWAHRSTDTFWRPNLRSGAKLREKFEMLVSQADRAGFQTLAAVAQRVAPEPVDPRAAIYMQGNRWADMFDLAGLEARLEAEGVPIPWLTHPVRATMRADLAGHPLKPVRAPLKAVPPTQGGERA